MMRLTSLHLLRAPGLAREIALEGVDPGLVLLVGPNASGKSTLGRVLQVLLWPRDVGSAGEGLHAQTRWHLDDGPATAEVASGRVQWLPEAPAVAVAAAGAWRLSVAELLRADGKTDRVIADEIERALTGGYDISKALDAFGASSRVPRLLRNQLDGAREQRRQALARADALAAEEQDLERLVGARRQALDAVGELTHAHEALALAGHRRELALVRAKLGAFPEGLDLLRGDELDVLADLDRDREQVATELTGLERGIAEQNGIIETRCLPVEEPTDEIVAAWVQRARALVELEREVGAAERHVAAAHAAVARAEAQLLAPGAGQGGPATAQDLDALERHVHRRRQRRAEVDAEQRIVDAIPTVPPAASEAVLREGIQALRGWLAVARPVARLARPPWILAVAAIGLLCLLAGALLGGGWWALPGAALAGFGAGAWFGIRAAAGADEGGVERKLHRERFERLAVDDPAAWQAAEVHDRLAALERELDQAREAALWAARLQEQQACLARSQRALADVEAKASEATGRMGLAPDWLDLSLLQQAQRLDALAGARLADAEAAAALERAVAHRDEARASLNGWLVSFGLGKAEDGAAAIAAIEALERRLRDLRGAGETLADLERQVASGVERREGLEAKLADLYARCGLASGDEETLAMRLARLDEWRKVAGTCADLERRITDVEAALADRPALLEVDEAAARQVIAELEQAAGRLDEASGAVAAVEERLAIAAVGTTLESARNAVHDAEVALAEARDRAIEDAIGRAMVDWLRGQVSREHTPPVLERAHARLLRFTRQTFGLDVDPEAGFVAVDIKAGQRRQLSQLSDGTRMQLLLAARLAFLEQAEGDGPKLPLFLDESLSTTDPHRFEQIGRALLDLVAEGRQIIYATAEPAELQAWQALCTRVGSAAPQVIELGEAVVERPWRDDLPAAPSPLPPPPPVRGHDAASYARALGVAPPAPGDPVSRWHVLHLLHDDLGAVARLVAAGIDTAGQFEAFREGRRVPLPVDDATAARLQARAGLLATVLELRAVGRNQRVNWPQVQASGAVTPTFEGRMRDLLASHGHDAGRYFAAVSALERFRDKSRTALREHLAAEGLIAEVPPLGRDEIVTRAATRLAGPMVDGALDLAEVRAMVDWVERVVGGD